MEEPSLYPDTEVLDVADSAALLVRLAERFADQQGGTWRDPSARARPHHSYQVFEVYPWAAMLRAGLPPGPAVSVLDRCRIRSGVVEAVEGEWVSARSSVLGWEAPDLAPGKGVVEQARWAVNGLSLMPAPVVGDVVTLHHRLEAEQRAALGLGESD